MNQQHHPIGSPPTYPAMPPGSPGSPHTLPGSPPMMPAGSPYLPPGSPHSPQSPHSPASPYLQQRQQTLGMLDAWLASGWDPNEVVDGAVFVVAAAFDDPELAMPLREIESAAPYPNFIVHDATTSASQRRMDPKRAGIEPGPRSWYIAFTRTPELEPGQLQIDCNATNYLEHTATTDRPFEIQVRYNRTIEAFRALGHILAGTVKTRDAGDVRHLFVRERAQFDRLGLMLDCSRGGVPNLRTVRFFLVRLALLGINTLMLYTEDTFEVPGEPWFGYLRGRFSQAELKEIDDYAFAFGIEVIPCIQTLGHLGQILQWPAYAHLRDTHEVLLAHSKDTYTFLDKVIRAACAPFRSRKVHVGMDEAAGLGEGQHKQYFPGHHRTQIFLDHLEVVTRICRSIGREPLIWSDMLFCLANQNMSLNGYYSDSGVSLNHTRGASPTSTSRIPDVELVLWDYYHTSPATYADRIQAHCDLGCGDPWVASGIWSWNRLQVALPFTFQVTQACLTAAKETGKRTNGAHHVRNMLTTLWGDDGNEGDWFSAFPALVYYAHAAYTEHADAVSPAAISRWFTGVFGGKLEDWMHACRIDNLTLSTAPVTSQTQFPPNLGKWLLWEDPVYAHLSPQAPPAHQLEAEYKAIHARLDLATSPHTVSQYPFNTHLALARDHAGVLALKTALRPRLVAAYQAGALAELVALADGQVASLARAVARMARTHRGAWMRRFAPFGWEILDLRYGGLRARVETLKVRIAAFARTHERMSTRRTEMPSSMNTQSMRDPEGDEAEEDEEEDEVMALPELEVTPRVVWEGMGDRVVVDYARACTPMRGMGTG
ncbi:hypothetical protein H9P43_005390 [Blastocladiella emersonii ATCC 22665]|nr:hypothetical protein H9P43_005390 [Blastocladiella emersonii ATCC 22665]